MNKWEPIWSYYNEYILQKRWNESINDFDFRVERRLLNLPRVDIVHLPSLSYLTEEHNTLLKLGYTYQFIIGDIHENVNYDYLSLSTLKNDIFYLAKAQDALTTMQREVARTMDIWIS